MKLALSGLQGAGRHLSHRQMRQLAPFIRENTEQILSEWESFARTFPMAEPMDVAAIRDHAKEMLGVIARDLETPQTLREQTAKAKGKALTNMRRGPTATEAHAA